MPRRWRGVLAIEAVQTGDGRIFVPGCFTWVAPPISLAWLEVQQHGDMLDGGVVVGNIDSITRVGDEIIGTGVIDDTSEEGIELIASMDNGTAPLGNRWGLSLDMDDMAVEIVDNNLAVDTPAEDVDDELAEQVIISAAGRLAQRIFLRGRDQIRSLLAAAGEPDPGTPPMMTFAMDDILERYTRARIRGVTVLSVAAFDGCYIELEPVDATVAPAPGAPPAPAPAPAPAPGARALVAAGAPVRPPRAWFDEPEPCGDDPRLVPQYEMGTNRYLGLACPLTISDDGQVYGHLAPENRCHIGNSNTCITAPRPVDYSFFHIGSVQLDDGALVDTGPMVCGADHASTAGLSPMAARDHYAHTGLAWADVTVRNGEHGPWVTGALRPNVTAELVRVLRGGGISGDWRGDPEYELCGILAVNTPGLTVQRVAALVASGGTAARMIDLLPLEPSLDISGTSIRMVTAPVQRADVKPCGCGHATPSLSVVEELMFAELRAMRSDLSDLTRPAREATARARAQEAIAHARR